MEQINLGLLNYPDFLTVDGLLSLRKSTSYNALQTLQNMKNPNPFSDIREISDAGSCVTETESDDGSLPLKSAKRSKYDTSSESLMSMSLDLSSSSLEVRPESVTTRQPSGATEAQQPLTPGASFSRGKYKCRHCGVFKTNHVCPVIADSVLMCSQSTSVDPVMVMVIDHTLVIAEKTIGVRKWQG